MRLCLIVVLAAIGGIAVPAAARAEWQPGGALTARGLLRAGTMIEPLRRCDADGCEARDAGGSVLVDLWAPFDVVQLGVATGLSFIGGEDDETRVFTPIGVSFAIRAQGSGSFAFTARARAGIWAGATNPGFRVGPWTSIGAHLEWFVDPRIAFTAGMDLDVLYLHGTTALYAPSLGLTWRPE
jgi:hypothetical protein